LKLNKFIETNIYFEKFQLGCSRIIIIIIIIIINVILLQGHPKYDFSYGVVDRKTGDTHGQKESRDGHKVVGEYTVKEPGGNTRTVKYYTDKHGFHADVHNSNGNYHYGGGHGGRNDGHGTRATYAVHDEDSS
jgi:hypothetical protein